MKAKKEPAYNEGNMETIKFADRKEPYYKGLEAMKEMGYDIDDFIHHFPCFAGHMTISRFLAFHEIYQKTFGLAGHIAEIGVYKGATLLFFAKLAQIFEPESLTQIHGFDWFQGSDPSEFETAIPKGSYKESYERVKQLIEVQQLQNIIRLHKMDVTKELDEFFKKHLHLRFKIVFFDAGMYEVVKKALPYFWERLNKGGILILDQYNFEVAPGETMATHEIIKDYEIKSFPYTWMPTGYIIK